MANQRPTVQVIERPHSAAAAPAFTVEEMMVMGYLLDRYRENTMAINDTANAQVAEGALAKLGELLHLAGSSPAPASPQATPRSPTPPPAASASSAPTPTSTGGSRRRSRRADARSEDAAASSTPSADRESDDGGTPASSPVRAAEDAETK
jgi:hypothetical protein